MISAEEALERLQEGNRRFSSAADSSTAAVDPRRRQELVSGQNPFAIILGCSDSRVPAEIVFNQGLGDLFVIRVAGNIVAPSQIDSIEFAANVFGTRLVIVLGHSFCGAVTATLEEIQKNKPGPPNLQSIVGRIRPAVEPLVEAAGGEDHDTLLDLAVRANIRASSNHVRSGSPVLEKLIRQEGLIVVGAEYDLESGKVDFFDGIPST